MNKSIAQRLLFLLDTMGYLDSRSYRHLPGVHFCPDWDYMAIYEHSPEWDCCTCDKEKLLERHR